MKLTYISRIFMASGLIFSSLIAGSQITFQKTYGGYNSDFGYSLQPISGGGYIICGRTESIGSGGFNVFLVKTDNTGDTLWTRTYGKSFEDNGYSVRQTNDGGYIITGSTLSAGQGSYDILLIKTDNTGTISWVKTYGGANTDEAYSVQQTNDNGYILAGYTYSYGAGGGNSDCYIIKTNANGDTLWTRTFGGALNDVAYCISQTFDSGYIMSGTYAGSALLVKFNKNGNVQWSKIYQRTYYSDAYSFDMTNDGGYIFAGTTYEDMNGNDKNFFVVRTTSSGDTLWTRAYGGNGDEHGYSVKQDNQGGFIVAGSGFNLINQYDIYLIRTYSNGNLIWASEFDGTAEPVTVQQNDNSGYDIVGTEATFGPGKVYFIQTDTSGSTNCLQLEYAPPVHRPNNVQVLVPSSVTISHGGVPANFNDIMTWAGSYGSVQCSSAGISGSSTVQDQLLIYPNPSDGKFTLSLTGVTGSSGSVKILDMLGSEILNRDLTVTPATGINQEIDLNSAPPGIYLIQVIAGGKTWTRELSVK